MQNRRSLWWMCGFVLASLSCGGPGQSAQDTDLKLEWEITNPLDFSREEVVMVPSVNWQELSSSKDELVWTQSGQPIPSQWIPNAEGVPSSALLWVETAGNERQTVELSLRKQDQIIPDFPKRTQAELSHKFGGHWEGHEYMEGHFENVQDLRVPPEHTDHSWYIRYEGPGWESDKVGYRFYLDWRNATDIFGKKTHNMVLQGVGLDGFDSYHEPSDWGMDILKVGKSLGVGSLATWFKDTAQRVAVTDSVFCRITENGLLRSVVATQYDGWQAGDFKTDVTSKLSIEAGSRLTRHEVTVSSEVPNLCTGLVKLDGGEVVQDAPTAGWSYLATYGKQSLANDRVGMAVLFRTEDLIERTEDALSHLVVLRPVNRQLTYYFLAAWEQEPDGITSLEAFTEYLTRVVECLNHPFLVETIASR